jgi:hypothetical protein
MEDLLDLKIHPEQIGDVKRIPNISTDSWNPAFRTGFLSPMNIILGSKGGKRGRGLL